MADEVVLPPLSSLWYAVSVCARLLSIDHQLRLRLHVLLAEGERGKAGLSRLEVHRGVHGAADAGRARLDALARRHDARVVGLDAALRPLSVQLARQRPRWPP